MIRSCCTARIGPHTCNIDRRLQNFSCRDAHKVAKDLSLSARSFCLPYRFNVLRCFKFRQSTAFCRLFFFCLYLSSNPRTARKRERDPRVSTSSALLPSMSFGGSPSDRLRRWKKKEASSAVSSISWIDALLCTKQHQLSALVPSSTSFSSSG